MLDRVRPAALVSEGKGLIGAEEIGCRGEAGAVVIGAWRRHAEFARKLLCVDSWLTGQVDIQYEGPVGTACSGGEHAALDQEASWIARRDERGGAKSRGRQVRVSEEQRDQCVSQSRLGRAGEIADEGVDGNSGGGL